jgi:hypothetical protein
MNQSFIFSELPRTLVYLDPGSGSLIVQMLIAAVVAGGLLLRAFWSKLTGKSKKTEDDLHGTSEDVDD